MRKDVKCRNACDLKCIDVPLPQCLWKPAGEDSACTDESGAVTAAMSDVCYDSLCKSGVCRTNVTSANVTAPTCSNFQSGTQLYDTCRAPICLGGTGQCVYVPDNEGSGCAAADDANSTYSAECYAPLCHSGLCKVDTSGFDGRPGCSNPVNADSDMDFACRMTQCDDKGFCYIVANATAEGLLCPGEQAPPLANTSAGCQQSVCRSGYCKWEVTNEDGGCEYPVDNPALTAACRASKCASGQVCSGAVGQASARIRFVHWIRGRRHSRLFRCQNVCGCNAMLGLIALRLLLTVNLFCVQCIWKPAGELNACNDTSGVVDNTMYDTCYDSLCIQGVCRTNVTSANVTAPTCSNFQSGTQLYDTCRAPICLGGTGQCVYVPDNEGSGCAAADDANSTYSAECYAPLCHSGLCKVDTSGFDGRPGCSNPVNADSDMDFACRMTQCDDKGFCYIVANATAEGLLCPGEQAPPLANTSAGCQQSVCRSGYCKWEPTNDNATCTTPVAETSLTEGCREPRCDDGTVRWGQGAASAAGPAAYVAGGTYVWVPLTYRERLSGLARSG